MRGEGSHRKQAPRWWDARGLTEKSTPMVRGDGIHRKQAPRWWDARGLTKIKLNKGNRQLLRTRRCSWVDLKVMLEIELITIEKSSWKHLTRFIYLSFQNAFLEIITTLYTERNLMWIQTIFWVCWQKCLAVSDTAKLYGYFIKTVIVEGILLHQPYVFNTHIQTDIAATDQTWLWFH